MPTDERPVAAVATALAPAAVAAIRVSGDGAIDLLATRFSRPGVLRDAAGHTLHHGVIVTAAGLPVDEVLVAVYRRPRSYTGEEAAEVFCHGSPAGVRRVLAELLSAGFSAAGPGEFTRRAFLNGKLDLTRAEAVNEVIRAQTTASHALALDRLAGSVEAAVREIRGELVAVMAQLAIQLDYPEEETGDVAADRARLGAAAYRSREIAATFRTGRLFQEGARVAIAGRTNAGKSSLFNRLLQHDRSIVSDIHGTTRDYVESLIDVEGVPVRLFDTAGLRAATEEIEEEGIRRSRALIAAADLVLYVVDALEGVTAEDESRIAEIGETTPVIVLLNKIDALSEGGHAGAIRDPRAAATDSAVPPESRGAPGGTGRPLPVSAVTGDGVADLNRAMLAELLRGDAADTGVIIDSERQHALLLRAAEAIDRTIESLDAGMPADAVAVDLQDALDAVGEITGEVASAEILDEMFGSFCVGK
ncbi:MAG: tRNA uridine-5-carboxymethylaminomethyl(34) synthesis GTPase MnmE [Spirochaetota bacterium]